MHFNTNPAGSHRPSPSALAPLAGDSYGEEMLFSENLGKSADFSELIIKKIKTNICARETEKRFLHKHSPSTSSEKNPSSQRA